MLSPSAALQVINAERAAVARRLETACLSDASDRTVQRLLLEVATLRIQADHAEALLGQTPKRRAEDV